MAGMRNSSEESVIGRRRIQCGWLANEAAAENIAWHLINRLKAKKLAQYSMQLVNEKPETSYVLKCQYGDIRNIVMLAREIPSKSISESMT